MRKKMKRATGTVRDERTSPVTEDGFRLIIQQSADAIIIVDSAGVVRYVNPAGISIFGRPENEFTGRVFGLPVVLGENVEIEIMGGDGKRHVGEMRVVETRWEREDAFLAMIRDITARKNRERELIESLNEKEIILKEIHHRVKNNMQVVSSLINLQASVVKDEATAMALRETRDRIRSMSLVHEKLYRSSDLCSVNMADYVASLCQELFQAYQTAPIELVLDIDSIFLNTKEAISMGLLVHELVSNALKHAFPGKNDGVIRVSFGRTENLYRLSVADNGVGFPEGVDYKSTQSLGMQIAVTFARQLGGELLVERNDGTVFTLEFTGNESLSRK